MEYSEKYFHHAYQLAEKGRGRTSPNPFVGAVLVKDDKVIGTGYTQAYGQDHAEVQAIKAAKSQCRGADLYVTLEPCSHFGATPPCADLIIKNGIKRVFIGMKDPNPLVKGKGIQKLKEAGIEIIQGIWKDKIEKQLESYIIYITQKRPFIFMKSAVTLDGKIADNKGNSRWISGEESRIYTHHLRQEADAVVTGIGTVLADNPLLNVRLPEVFKQPLRVVLDPVLQVPIQSDIVQTAREFPTLLIKSSEYANQKKEDKLKELGLNIEAVSPLPEGLDLKAVSNLLYDMKKMQVMIEAGPRLCSSFLRHSLVDKLFYFMAPKIIGGKHILFDDVGVEDLADSIDFHIDELKKIGQDILVIAYPR
jgi:diaminohydroxyphosphoribosylaminopyrimidine deaminase / 5-amino-6-(5-phosphoribosylamino)uracil reductase